MVNVPLDDDLCGNRPPTTTTVAPTKGGYKITILGVHSHGNGVGILVRAFWCTSSIDHYCVPKINGRRFCCRALINVLQYESSHGN